MGIVEAFCQQEELKMKTSTIDCNLVTFLRTLAILRWEILNILNDFDSHKIIL